jgi:hypothetical protein
MCQLDVESTHLTGEAYWFLGLSDSTHHAEAHSVCSPKENSLQVGGLRPVNDYHVIFPTSTDTLQQTEE